MTAGVIYIAYGDSAREEAARAIVHLKKRCSLPVMVIGEPVTGADHYKPFDDRNSKGRLAKVNLYWLSPFSLTLYMDADTVVKQDLDRIFYPIHEGFDMAAIPSSSQGSTWLWPLSDEEQRETVAQCGKALVVQGGVFAFGRSKRLEEFWTEWRRQWMLWQGPDQGALLRALHQKPLKLWLFGFPWNGGVVIGHRWAIKGRYSEWTDYRRRDD